MIAGNLGLHDRLVHRPVQSSCGERPKCNTVQIVFLKP